jgi:hypothetical protein
VIVIVIIIICCLHCLIVVYFFHNYCHRRRCRPSYECPLSIVRRPSSCHPPSPVFSPVVVAHPRPRGGVVLPPVVASSAPRGRAASRRCHNLIVVF